MRGLHRRSGKPSWGRTPRTDKGSPDRSRGNRFARRRQSVPRKAQRAQRRLSLSAAHRRRVGICGGARGGAKKSAARRSRVVRRQTPMTRRIPSARRNRTHRGIYDMLGNVREWVDTLYAPETRRPVTGRPPISSRRHRRDRSPAPHHLRTGASVAGGVVSAGEAADAAVCASFPSYAAAHGTTRRASSVLSARYHYYGPTLRVSDLGFRAAREAIQ